MRTTCLPSLSMEERWQRCVDVCAMHVLATYDLSEEVLISNLFFFRFHSNCLDVLSEAVLKVLANTSWERVAV